MTTDPSTDQSTERHHLPDRADPPQLPELLELPDPPDPAYPPPEDFGVGCRFSVFPLCDDFGAAVLGALGAADPTGLQVRTDDVSTYAAGAEDAILRYVRDVVADAAGRAPHVMASLLLSRGCPGEVRGEVRSEVRDEVRDEVSGGAWCAAPEGGPPPGRPPTPRLARSGIRTAAHWSLYPLGTGDHMELIAGAVEGARAAGTYGRSEHYATRLEGDLSDVLTTIADGWLAAGARVPHVVSHATLSLGSPAPAPAPEVTQ